MKRGIKAVPDLKAYGESAELEALTEGMNTLGLSSGPAQPLSTIVQQDLVPPTPPGTAQIGKIRKSLRSKNFFDVMDALDGCSDSENAREIWELLIQARPPAGCFFYYLSNKHLSSAFGPTNLYQLWRLLESKPSTDFMKTMLIRFVAKNPEWASWAGYSFFIQFMDKDPLLANHIVTNADFLTKLDHFTISKLVVNHPNLIPHLLTTLDSVIVMRQQRARDHQIAEAYTQAPRGTPPFANIFQTLRETREAAREYNLALLALQWAFTRSREARNFIYAHRHLSAHLGIQPGQILNEAQFPFVREIKIFENIGTNPPILHAAAQSATVDKDKTGEEAWIPPFSARLKPV